MCRHLAYCGPELAVAELLYRGGGLYEQSWAPRMQRYGTVNADGFGLGWYPPGTGERPSSSTGPADTGPADTAPARYRRAVPIWADQNLPDLARAMRSGCLLAAVRDATPGTGAEETAAAPYAYGNLLFSHNGAVPRWQSLPEDLGAPLSVSEALNVEARCDSAVLWALIHRRLRAPFAPTGASAARPLRADGGTARVLANTVLGVAAVRPDVRLNLLVTDGRRITAVRHGDSLWYRAGRDGVLVASEPDADKGWREVPDHHLLVTGSEWRVTVVPLASAAREDVEAPQEEPHPVMRAATHGQPRRAPRREDHAPMNASPASKAPGPARRLGPDTGRSAVPGRFTLAHRLPEGHLREALRADALKGLSSVPKTLPPKWFYDGRGSALFEEITRLPEYYPTRAEQEILRGRAPEVARMAGHVRTLVELGAGSSRKTRLLLDALRERGALRRYAPLDVSPEALTEAGEVLVRDYPDLEISAVVTDYEVDLTPPGEGPYLLAFLGGTLGNLDTAERGAFYAALRDHLVVGRDALLLGVDLVKDPDVLVRAYDDGQGVTAEFNKNVLHVLNRELGADFPPESFDHRAVWNAEESRIEMWLRARGELRVRIPALDLDVEFERGEQMRTEISVKFSRARLEEELGRSGFAVRHWWVGEGFALLYAERV